MKGIHFPVEEFQKQFDNQLQALRSEILKYKEVEAQYHLCNDSNRQLNSKLATQAQHLHETNAKLTEACDRESDLKSQYIQLGLEMDTLRQHIGRTEQVSLQLESEVSSLQVKLSELELALQTASENLDVARQQQEKEAESGAHWRVGIRDQTMSQSAKCYQRIAEEAEAKATGMEVKLKQNAKVPWHTFIAQKVLN